MNLLDVNVLIYAFRSDIDDHKEYRAWLIELLAGDSAFGLSEKALAGVVRVTTHPKIFQSPSTLREAFQFIDSLRMHPLCRIIQPSTRHWALFRELCERAGAKGNLVTDAWFAALAIEAGCVWITSDRDFARFPGLRWQHPLKHQGIVVNSG